MSTLRLSGLATGMDTEAMVKELMKAQRLKVDRLERQQVGIEWEKEIWQGFNTKVLSFFNNELFNSKLTSTYNNKIASTSSSLVNASATTAATQGLHKFKVTQIAESASLVSNKIGDGTATGSTKVFDLISDPKPTGDVLFKLNDTEITVTSETTVQELVSSLNAVDGVKVNFDDNLDTMFISTSDTGKDATLTFDDQGNADANKLLDAIGLLSGNRTDVGQNAEVTYNGTHSFEFSNNNVEINGIKLQLLGADINEEISVSVTADTDKTFDNITGFIDKYNEILDEANTLLNADPNRDYKPLTAEERSQMDDKSIELWETKVKSSLLRRDPTLSDYTNLLRSSVTENYGDLSSIGISTASYKERGKLHIDEEKLRTAIEKDPDKVQEIFNKLGEKLYEGTNEKLKSTTQSSALTLYNDKSMDKELEDIEDRMREWEDRLASMEDRYYKQFAAMEQAIQKMQSQTASFSSMMGGMM